MNIRVSDSVSGFKQKAMETWGVSEWDRYSEEDCVFFGLYVPEDYFTMAAYRGKKSVFWCGSDILALVQNKERQDFLKEVKATHYCETEDEAIKLRSVGIEPTIIPSFLGSVYSYPVSFKRPRIGEYWKIWLCGHPSREHEYGFEDAKKLAELYPNIQVHFYGVSGESTDRIIYHGKVSEEQLDKEIKDYHCGLRPNINDGVSEVVIKSLLMGQYPISKQKYEGVMNFQNFEELKECMEELFRKMEPNLKTRCLWIKRLNQFPWNKTNFYNSNED